MRKQVLMLIGFLCVVLLGSCSKEDTECEIKTVEATIQQDGSVYLYAYITGCGDNAEAGFCYKANEIPHRTDNTVTVQQYDRKIHVVIPPGLDPTEEYFFRSWVSGRHKRKYGNTLGIKNIQPLPSTGCLSQPNTFSINTFDRVYSFTDPVYNYPGWNLGNGFIVASTAGPQLQLMFSAPLKAGTYKTTNNLNAKDRVLISFNPSPQAGPYYITMDTGNVVQVTDFGNHLFDINICNATKIMNGIPIKLNAHLTAIDK